VKARTCEHNCLRERKIGCECDDAPTTLQFTQVKRILLTWRWFRETVGEGVACISFRASAHWRVIDDSTLGSCTAWSRTRVTTPLPHARSVAGTFRVNAAFGSAVWWYTHVISQARARRGTSNVSALRVGTARRRHTRVQHHWGSWPWGRRYKNTGKQGSGTTVTHHTNKQVMLKSDSLIQRKGKKWSIRVTAYVGW